MHDTIPFFSSVKLQGFEGAPQQPVADRLFSFMGRDVTVIKNASAPQGFEVEETAVPWQKTLQNIGLLVLAVLTILPLAIALIQKGLYHYRIHTLLNETETSWANARDAFGKVHFHFPKIVTDQMVDSWFSQDTAKIKKELVATEKRESAKNDLVTFLRLFETDEDLITITNGKKEWKVNRLTASYETTYFNSSMQFKEGGQKKIEFKAPDGSAYPAEIMELFVSYLQNQDSSKIQYTQAFALYAIADQLLIDDLKAQAKAVITKEIAKGELSPQALIQLWKWALLHEPFMTLHCAQKFKNNAPIGYHLEATQMHTLHSALQNLSATLTDSSVAIARYNKTALETILPHLKQDSITTLNLQGAKLPVDTLCKIVTNLHNNCSTFGYTYSLYTADENRQIIQAINQKEGITALHINDVSYDTSNHLLAATIDQVKATTTLRRIKLDTNTHKTYSNWERVLRFIQEGHPTLCELSIETQYNFELRGVLNSLALSYSNNYPHNKITITIPAKE